MNTPNSGYRILHLLLILLICIGCSRSESIEDKVSQLELKEFQELLADGRPFYNLDQANAMADDLIPVIETITQRQFKSRPEIRLIDSEAFKDLLAREKTLVLMNNSGNQPLDDALHSKMISGLYSKKDRIIYLLPQRVALELRFNNLDEKYGLDIAKETIAHELTHALQDQYINLEGKLANLPGAEEVYAFLATIEGHAVFVARKASRRLGLKMPLDEKADSEKLKKLYEKFIRFDPFFRSQHMVYAKGEKFIEHHFQKGGNKKVWEIMAFPPVDTAMILYPDTYCRKSCDRMNYKKLLENIYDFAADFKTGNVSYLDVSLGKFDFSSCLDELDASQKKIFYSVIRHLQFQSIFHNNELMGQMGFILLNDQPLSPEVFSIIEQVFHTLFEILGLKNMTDWKDMVLLKQFQNDLDRVRQLSAIYEIKTDTHKEANIMQKQTIIIKDNMVFTFMEAGMFDLYPYDLETAAAKVFSKYKNACEMANNQDFDRKRREL